MIAAPARALLEVPRTLLDLNRSILTLIDEGRMPRKLRPNQTARELRYEYLHATPAERLRSGIELSHLGLALAAQARARKDGKGGA